MVKGVTFMQSGNCTNKHATCEEKENKKKVWHATLLPPLFFMGGWYEKFFDLLFDKRFEN